MEKISFVRILIYLVMKLMIVQFLFLDITIQQYCDIMILRNKNRNQRFLRIVEVETTKQ